MSAGGVLAITPNPAVDLTWHADRLVAGGSHRVAAARVRAGGKGVNVARVAHGRRMPVSVVTTAGGTAGDEFARDLAAGGIPHRLVPVAGETRRTVTIVDEASGDAMIFLEPGVALQPAEWRALRDAADAESADAAVLTVSGSLPPDSPPTAMADFAAIARRRGIPSIFDSSGAALLAAAAAGATVLKPNRAELREATGIADPVTAARSLLDGGTRLVVLSLGADGMMAVTPGPVVLHARLPEVLAGNPTGAGDAAVAALACALATGSDDPADLLRVAVAWSAAAVLEPVAGDISPRHAEFASRVVIRPLD
ncbi:ribokinase [Microbacterium mangrovi]|uniref:Ribokinase n=1 Tax=Microbacterium mangrovi TaxID=1348253 RepID=A0A0B2A1U4_9MICO|nr:hexose kinase [Microbacterium mangrovi]KHK95739.1 ribokinase [Microbacterium mangrovi]